MADTSLFNQVLEWIQNQKHVYIAMKAATGKATDYVGFMVERNWPMIYTWSMHIGRLSLLFSVLWLDCSLRGLASLLHLGSTAYFVLLWCSFLSMTAMTGLFYVLISLGIACLAVLFLGYAPAILIMVIFGAMMLWVYGSFWITGALVIIGGSLFTLNHTRLAILVTTVYSMYCAKIRIGWLGLVLCMNLAFISNDILIHLLKGNVNENESKCVDDQSDETKGKARNFCNGSGSTGPNGEEARVPKGRPSGESSQTAKFVEIHGESSSSGLAEADTSSAQEVLRILHSSDHYAALGLSRNGDIDVAVLKREYRKKAMLVHPDKNMGNAMAVESFKKLQSAYEVLLDSSKKSIYDEELRREELTKSFQRFQSDTQKNGRYGSSEFGFFNYVEEVDDIPACSRKIACKKCNSSHIWICTNRTKARARWCQDCQDYHQAKNGDGWVELSGHSLFFGMLQKVDVPRAFACAESRIFDVSEWVVCQGMSCPPNTHKPSFHVNATFLGKNTVRGGSRTHKDSGNDGMATNLDEYVTEEEFLVWVQNAMASGIFDSADGVWDNGVTRPGNHAKSNRKKKKGKKQW